MGVGSGRIPQVNARSIRSRIAITLIVPLVTMAGLWAFTVGQTVGSAMDLWNANSTGRDIGRPGDNVVVALQNERSRSQFYLGSGLSNAGVLRAALTTTDAAVADFRSLSDQYAAAGLGTDLTRAGVKDALVSLSGLGQIRSAVNSGTITRDTAMADYNQVIGSVLAVLDAAAVFSDPSVDRQMHALLGISQARELLNQEDAMLSGASAAGRFAMGEYQKVVAVTGAFGFQLNSAGAELSPQDASAYANVLQSPAMSAVRAANDTILSEGSSESLVPITLADWRSTFSAADKLLHDFLVTGFEGRLSSARSAGIAALARLYLAAVVGLLVIVLAVFISMRNGRSVVRRLTALRTAANELAHRRLPEIVAGLRAGDQPDVGGDVLDLPPGSDEIAQVGEAFAEVRRSAVASAVAEAKLRKGMDRVFVNISRRNQSLINRQLKLLEEMRTMASTPEQRRNVALADHLAVRMRRHAEDLVILAGDKPSRGWHSREPLDEVIRSGIAEVENGDRIEMRTVTEVALPGQVVPDVIHLLAELLENATAYSPPDTPVYVTAERVPHGICVEIEDRGIGMTAQARTDANGRLAEPPDFDPADSARLGLFVVAQLAARRGLKVSLRPSSCDGITAVVLIPNALLEQPGGPTKAGSGRTPPARHESVPEVEVRWRFLEPSATRSGGSDVLEAEVVDDARG